MSIFNIGYGQQSAGYSSSPNSSYLPYYDGSTTNLNLTVGSSSVTIPMYNHKSTNMWYNGIDKFQIVNFPVGSSTVTSYSPGTPIARLELDNPGLGLISYQVSCGGVTYPPAATFSLSNMRADIHLFPITPTASCDGYTIGSTMPNPGMCVTMTDQNSNKNDALFVQQDGKIGIGNNNPQAQVHIKNDNGTAIHQGAALDATLLVDGKVGIGTNFTTPLYTLQVNGQIAVSDPSSSNTINVLIEGNGRIHCRSFDLDLTPIPDYVFEKNYTILKIEELAKYVGINKHLPNIPSAKEYEKRGKVDIGELQMKLLEKVEELSLYIIELNDKVKKLDEANKTLEQELKTRR